MCLPLRANCDGEIGTVPGKTIETSTSYLRDRSTQACQGVGSSSSSSVSCGQFFLCSGFDKALIITADGAGDSVSTAIYDGHGTNVRLLAAFPVSSSLGHFYSYLTALLGLGTVLGHEGKTMALAGFGGNNGNNGDILLFRPLSVPYFAYLSNKVGHPLRFPGRLATCPTSKSHRRRRMA